jgi:flavin-dependent trigonelline monooxygenase, reductase component
MVHGIDLNVPGEPMNVEPVEKAMLALSYGVHVISSRAADGTQNLMIADWVMQVSFKPRLLAVSIENDARTLRFIRETGHFTVNLLHEKNGHVIARHVVMPSEGKKIKGRSLAAATAVTDKLDGLGHRDGPGDCAVLTDALGWVACTASEYVPAGDHTLVIGMVDDGGLLRSGEMLIERELGWEYAG